MNIAGMGAVYSAMYQHTAKVQNTATDKTSFSHQLQNASSVGKTEVEAYTDYLKSKYGNVSIQSIGKDQASLDRVGRGMSGSDVIIAPNILEQMATIRIKLLIMKIRLIIILIWQFQEIL